jgi:hypothetical protein
MKSKFCLSSTASFDKINKASTNKSSTKQAFSFGRTSRFISNPPMYAQFHSAVLKALTEEIFIREGLLPPALDMAIAQILQNV